MNSSDISRVIEMAWEDRTAFEAIFENYGLSEPEVIAKLRRDKCFVRLPETRLRHMRNELGFIS